MSEIDLMSHQLDAGHLLPAMIMTILTLTIVILLYTRRKRTGIKALTWLIYLFASLFLLGALETFTLIAHDYIFFLNFDDSTTPLIINPIRLANLVTIIIIFLFTESIMSATTNSWRFGTMIVFLTSISLVGLIDLALGYRLTTDMMIPFANPTGFDEFLFDSLQLYVVGYLGYMFYQQTLHTTSNQYLKYVYFLRFATLLYTLAMLYEFLEHLAPIRDINAFVSVLPTIILLAYTYLKYPNMIYLVPTDVKFLQLISVDSGVPVYVAEFDEDENSMEFLVGPGLSSIRNMLEELLKEQNNPFHLKSFAYSSGYLLFEEGSGLFALLQTDRLSTILLNSLKYFISEFELLFGPQLKSYKGKLEEVDGMSPDDLLRKCIPMIHSRSIISSLDNQS